MSINFQEILKELEYRVESGIIDLNKEEQVTKLEEILKENGISDASELAQKARVYFSYLKEIEEATPKRKQRVKGKSGEDPDISYTDSKGKKHSIKLSSAVSYDDNHPAYKAAMQYYATQTAKVKPDQLKKPSVPKADIGVSSAEKKKDKTDKKADAKKQKKVVRTEKETKRQRLNDATFISIIKNGLIPTQEKKLAGAGVFSMTKEQASAAVDFYTKRLKQPDYQLDLPRYEVTEENIDKAIDIMKKELGKDYSRVMASIQKAGGVDPKLTTGEAGVQRARDIIKLYLEFGGRSAVTGKVVPFNQMQLDHRIPYSSAAERVKEKKKKGIKTTLLAEQDELDSPDNWDLIETPINQQKNSLTGNELVEKLARTANLSDDEVELRQIKQELANIYETELLKSLVKSFKNGDYSGMNETNIQSMSADEIDVVMKAWNYWHPNKRDAVQFRKADPNYDKILQKNGIKPPPPDHPATIQRGQAQQGGSRARGIKWPVPIRKKLTIAAMKKEKVLKSKKETNTTNLVLLKAVQAVKKASKDKEQRMAQLTQKIKGKSPKK